MAHRQSQAGYIIIFKKRLTNIVRENTIKTMKRGIQKKLADMAGVSPGHLAHILNGKRRASYDTGLRLAMITGTAVPIWINGHAKQRREAAIEWAAEFERSNDE
jgi:plasmid maintenance system antidote protein VapI